MNRTVLTEKGQAVEEEYQPEPSCTEQEKGETESSGKLALFF